MLNQNPILIDSLMMVKTNHNNSMKNIKTYLLIILFTVVIAVIPYVGWKVSRWWNYKMSYQDQVQAEIQKAIEPLNDRITKLEFQVKNLRGVE